MNKRLITKWKTAAQRLANVMREVQEADSNASAYLAMDTLHLMVGPTHDEAGRPLRENSVADVLIPSSGGGDW